MTDQDIPVPRSLRELQRMFPDDRACADYLAEARWPEGFVCPACGSVRGWRLECRPTLWECQGCSKQTSVTAGTIMHRSKIGLIAWFWAAWLVSTHSNGISARQLWFQLGFGSYKTAWLLLQKLRRSMVDPDREKLEGTVQMDETFIPFRVAADPITRGRSTVGRMPVVGAVELVEFVAPNRNGDMVVKRGLGRVRLELAPGAIDRPILQGFCDRHFEEGTMIHTDGLRAYANLERVEVEVVTRKYMDAHVALPWIHRIFSNLKRWGMGTFHGFRPKHIQTYLREFEFRFNRRRHRDSSFLTILRIGCRLGPQPYAVITA